VTLHPPLRLACLFTVPMGSAPFPLSSGAFLTLLLLQAFPLLVAEWGPPLLPSLTGLFIYSSVRDLPSPPLQHSGHPALFATCLFLLLFIIQFVFFSFFPGWGRSVQGAMLIWSRVVCGSTMCHLAHLVVCFSWAGRSWCLAVWEPSWFLHLPWSGDAMHGLGVWRSWSFASSS
jgi:hypothetical protein